MIERKDLSDEQEHALQTMLMFARGHENQMLFKGYAGTGKTVTIKLFLDCIERDTNYNVVCTAPTNEAVRVLSKTTGRKYSHTIYSLLGLALIHEDDKEPVLKTQGKAKLAEYDIIVIDESSMIHAELFELIQQQLVQHSYIKVIYVGDDAQLPPVKDPNKESLVFKLPQSVELKTVQRVTLGNPIINAVTVIRNNINSPTDLFSRETVITEEGYGIEFYDSRDHFLELLYAEYVTDAYKADKNYVRVIAYTNKSVIALNERIRRKIFDIPNPKQFEIGEDLIVDQPIVQSMGSFSKIIYNVGERLRVDNAILQTDHEFNFKFWSLTVLNYEADEDEQIQHVIRVIHKDDDWMYYGVLKNLATECKVRSAQKYKVGNVEKPMFTKAEAWQPYFKFKDYYSWVKYSYATTTHKSQGSTFERVYVIERDLNVLTWDNTERNKLKYVAFTRASHILRILQ